MKFGNSCLIARVLLLPALVHTCKEDTCSLRRKRFCTATMSRAGVLARAPLSPPPFIPVPLLPLKLRFVLPAQ